MKRSNNGLVLVLSVAALIFVSNAANAALIAQYTLGENGLASSPVDTTGNHNFTPGDTQNPTNISVDTGNFAPVGGSTASLLFSTASQAAGFYTVANVNNSYPLTGNFEVDLWAKASPTGISDNRLISTDGANTDSLQIGVTGGHWTANVGNGFADLSAPLFSTGPLVTNNWTELTLMHVNGVTTFLVDNVAQPGTSNAAVVVGTIMHLGVTPGGSSGFAGNLDQVTISTVTPEPASFVLFGLATVGLAIAARRRRCQG